MIETPREVNPLIYKVLCSPPKFDNYDRRGGFKSWISLWDISTEDVSQDTKFLTFLITDLFKFFFFWEGRNEEVLLIKGWLNQPAQPKEKAVEHPPSTLHSLWHLGFVWEEGMEWNGIKWIFLEYSSLLLFGSFNGGNERSISLFKSLSGRKWNG